MVASLKGGKKKSSYGEEDDSCLETTIKEGEKKATAGYCGAPGAVIRPGDIWEKRGKLWEETKNNLPKDPGKV